MYIIRIGYINESVRSLDEASTVFQMHRDVAEIAGKGGASRFGPGKVYDGKRLVATVSYNGRVWNPDGSLAQERTVFA